MQQSICVSNSSANYSVSETLASSPSKSRKLPACEAALTATSDSNCTTAVQQHRAVGSCARPDAALQHFQHEPNASESLNVLFAVARLSAQPCFSTHQQLLYHPPQHSPHHNGLCHPIKRGIHLLRPPKLNPLQHGLCMSAQPDGVMCSCWRCDEPSRAVLSYTPGHPPSPFAVSTLVFVYAQHACVMYSASCAVMTPVTVPPS
jgi:hypothetical protein